jgi:streptogramin lyase
LANRWLPAIVMVTLGVVTPQGIALAFQQLPETDLVVEGRFPFTPPEDVVRYLHDVFLFPGFGSLWIVSQPNLLKLEPRDFTIAARINLPDVQGPLRLSEVGGGAIWIADTGTGTIYKVDAVLETVVFTIPATMRARDSRLGYGDGSLWVVTAGKRGDNILSRFNADTGAVEAEIELPSHSMGGAHFAFGSVWVVGTRRNELYRIDPMINATVSTTPLAREPAFITSAEGSIWVNSESGLVQRIDPETAKVVAGIETGYMGIGFLTAGGGYIWLGTSFSAVTQIDPKDNTIRRAWTGDQLHTSPDILYFDGSLWLYEAFKEYIRVKAPD